MIRGDHFSIKVTSNVREHLEAALDMAFAECPAATHFKMDPVLLYPFAAHAAQRELKSAPALWLWKPYPAHETGWVRLPFPLDATKAARFAWDWLSTAERGTYSGVDGSVSGDAFTVIAGHEASDTTVIVVPEWSVYGK